MFLRVCLISTLCFSSHLFSSAQLLDDETKKLSAYSILNNHKDIEQITDDQKLIPTKKKRRRNKTKKQQIEQHSTIEEKVSTHCEKDNQKDLFYKKLESLKNVLQEEAETHNFHQIQALKSIKETKVSQEKNKNLIELLEEQKARSKKKDQEIKNINEKLLAFDDKFKNSEENRKKLEKEKDLLSIQIKKYISREEEFKTEIHAKNKIIEELENQSKQRENLEKTLEKQKEEIENFKKERETFLEQQKQFDLLQNEDKAQTEKLIYQEEIIFELDQKLRLRDPDFGKQCKSLKVENGKLQRHNAKLQQQIKEKESKLMALQREVYNFKIDMPRQNVVQNKAPKIFQNKRSNPYKSIEQRVEELERRQKEINNSPMTSGSGSYTYLAPPYPYQNTVYPNYNYPDQIYGQEVNPPIQQYSSAPDFSKPAYFVDKNGLHHFF